MRYLFIFLSIIYGLNTIAQDNYEIQVYGSETVEKGKTMFELHSNYTINGSKEIKEGMLPTNHIFHETIEFTHGWTSWFETGFYLFNAIGSGNRTSYVGSHIRPRISAPTSWHLPVGLSISAEFGFQKKEYSPNTSTMELRGVVDKKINRYYVAVNPVFDESFNGPDKGRGLIFSPNVKGSYDLNKVLTIGIEYYGSTGPLFHFDYFGQQQHQLFLVTDLNLSPVWELNAGLGFGLTKSTDGSIFKIIAGRKF